MLSLDEYQQAMLDELDEQNKDRLVAIEQIQLNKRKVERAYNKHTKLRKFSEEDIIWIFNLTFGGKRFRTWQVVLKLGRIIHN